MYGAQTNTYVILSICDPPQENRDKGDSTLTTRFHSEIKEFDFSTLKVTSHLQRPKKSFFLLLDKI